MKIIIFEDQVFDQFFPLTYLRPVFELKCGINSLADKISAAYPNADCCLWARSYLRDTLVQRRPDRPVNDWSAIKGEGTLWINGRVLFDSSLKVNLEGPDEVGLGGDTVVYIRISAPKLATVAEPEMADDSFYAFLSEAQEQLPSKPVKATLFNYPWELVNRNAEVLKDDFGRLAFNGIHGRIHERAVIVGEKAQVAVAGGARIDPYVVIDASQGPVMVDREVKVQPFTRLEGPVYLGIDTQVMAGAHIREGTTLGPVCRVGGEVEEAIVHGYANKYHEGFLGHAYVCEWVNLGAITTNSDLRNDYGPVKVYNKGEIINTQSNKVGLFIGDHSKSSIGSLFNTGTVCGVMNNIIADGGLLPRIIPSFVFMQGRNASEGKGLDWFIQTARLAMARRKVELTEADEKLLRYVYDLTHKERNDTITRS